MKKLIFYFCITMCILFMYNTAEASIDCSSNSDCVENEYCDINDHIYPKKGKCKYNGGSMKNRHRVSGVGDIWFSDKMIDTFINAKNFCQSHQKKLLHISQLKCYKIGTDSLFTDNTMGYCCDKHRKCGNDGLWAGKLENFSITLQELFAPSLDRVSDYALPHLSLWVDTNYNNGKDTENQLWLDSGQIKKIAGFPTAYALCVDNNVFGGVKINTTTFITISVVSAFLIVLILLAYRNNYKKN